MFYLTTHSTHFNYGYMAPDIWLRTILIVRKETRCCHMGYSFRLVARVLLYAPSHRQDSTYHGVCYTSRGALARMRNKVAMRHSSVVERPPKPYDGGGGRGGGGYMFFYMYHPTDRIIHTTAFGVVSAALHIVITSCRFKSSTRRRRAHILLFCIPQIIPTFINDS